MRPITRLVLMFSLATSTITGCKAREDRSNISSLNVPGSNDRIEASGVEDEDTITNGSTSLTVEDFKKRVGELLRVLAFPSSFSDTYVRDRLYWFLMKAADKAHTNLTYEQYVEQLGPLAAVFFAIFERFDAKNSLVAPDICPNMIVYDGEDPTLASGISKILFRCNSGGKLPRNSCLISYDPESTNLSALSMFKDPNFDFPESLTKSDSLASKNTIPDRLEESIRKLHQKACLSAPTSESDANYRMELPAEKLTLSVSGNVESGKFWKVENVLLSAVADLTTDSKVAKNKSASRGCTLVKESKWYLNHGLGTIQISTNTQAFLTQFFLINPIGEFNVIARKFQGSLANLGCSEKLVLETFGVPSL